MYLDQRTIYLLQGAALPLGIAQRAGHLHMEKRIYLPYPLSAIFPGAVYGLAEARDGRVPETQICSADLDRGGSRNTVTRGRPDQAAPVRSGTSGWYRLSLGFPESLEQSVQWSALRTAPRETATEHSLLRLKITTRC